VNESGWSSSPNIMSEIVAAYTSYSQVAVYPDGVNKWPNSRYITEHLFLDLNALNFVSWYVKYSVSYLLYITGLLTSSQPRTCEQQSLFNKVRNKKFCEEPALHIFLQILQYISWDRNTCKLKTVQFIISCCVYFHEYRFRKLKYGRILHHRHICNF
jgi:hypothetical protein